MAAHLLTDDQKRIRMRIYQACLDPFNKNQTDFGIIVQLGLLQYEHVSYIILIGRKS